MRSERVKLAHEVRPGKGLGGGRYSPNLRTGNAGKVAGRLTRRPASFDPGPRCALGRIARDAFKVFSRKLIGGTPVESFGNDLERAVAEISRDLHVRIE